MGKIITIIKHLRINILIVIITINTVIVAQNYNQLNINIIDATNSLPSDECKFTYQDSKGFIWICTQEGLVRYDGYSLIDLASLTNEKIPTINGIKICEDNHSNLVFITTNKLIIYNRVNNSVEIIRINDLLNKSENSIVLSTGTIDKEGNIWLGHSSGIILYSPTKNLIKEYTLLNQSDSIESMLVSTLITTETGEIWAGTWGKGIAKYNKQTDSFICFPIFNNDKNILKSNNVNSLTLTKNGLLWVACWENGLYLVDIKNDKSLKIKKHFIHNGDNKQSIPGDIIYSIESDLLGNLWIGTPYGLGIIERPELDTPRFYPHEENINNKGTLSHNEVKHIMCDQSGVMWLSTFGGGINKIEFNIPQFHTYHIPTVDKQKKSQSVNGIITDSKNQLFLGIQSIGLGKYNLQTKQLTHYRELKDFKGLDIDINTAKCFEWDNDSNLWIGTRYMGLIKYNPKTGEKLILNTQTKEKLMLVREIHSISKDKHGHLWVASNNGLYRVLPSKQNDFASFEVIRFTKSNNSQSIPFNVLSDVIVDNEGILWVSTWQQGLYRSQNSVFDNLNKINFIPAINDNTDSSFTIQIIDLFIDNQANLWVGTSGEGLKIYDKKLGTVSNPIKYNQQNGLIIYGINQDNKNHIWATSNKGLMKLYSQKDGYEVELFTSNDGLQGNVFIKNAFHKTSNGNFIIGGHKGFNYFNPLTIKSDNYSPSVVFTEVTVSGEKQNIYTNTVDNPIILTHLTNHINIQFASLDYRRPKQNQYTYCLEGLDEEWYNTDSNGRSSTYANLKPGSYIFKLKATNNQGSWIEEPIILHIKVQSAPYKTWWAFICYAIIIIGILYALAKLNRTNLKYKQRIEIENINREKSENLNKYKLQFFTNMSHELLTPLSILKIISEQWKELTTENSEDVQTILSRNVNNLSRLIRQLLQFRKVETGNMFLELQQTNISECIRSIGGNYRLLANQKQITLQTDIQDSLVGYIDSEKIEIIVNNLLSNAFKYTPKDGKISLKLTTTLSENELHAIITVTDSGTGISQDELNKIFDQFYRAKNSSVTTEGIGIGLALAKNIAHLHHGNITAISTVGKGSCFELKIPIGENAYKLIKNPNKETTNPSDQIEIDTIIENKSVDAELKKYLILLVEDNQDLLQLMHHELDKHFTVITARNGKEALELASNEQISLIVSDIKMPDMNGYDLCKNIKNDIKSSHIQVILITANQDESSRLAGYESGADSFLTKPVDINTLKKRIELLLKKRLTTIQTLNTETLLNPQKIEITSIDEKLLKKAKALVENNISDPNLSVKTLSDHLALSSSMLYRKLKGTLDLTPNEFIRNIRLRKAAQMLQDPNINVSDVAYAVGFSDLSYFGVCFKKQYGTTPTNYQKEINQNQKKSDSI